APGDGTDAEAAAELLATDINNALRKAGVSNITASADSGTLTLTASDGSNIVVEGTTAHSGLTDGTYYGKITLTGTEAFSIGGNNPDKAGLTARTVSGTSRHYGPINVLSAQSAETVLRVVDNALADVNGTRAALGAVQNRFES